MFQFLYGTIKRVAAPAGDVLEALFQFLYGTIKSDMEMSVKGALFVFQFLYGTIKRGYVGWRRVTYVVSIPLRYN